MSKIRVDGQTMALSHPTRRAVYEALLNTDELSTVMLQKSTGVTRYHLYHHLQSLQKNNLVENHRDEGRARWWRVKERVVLNAAPSNDWIGNLSPEVRNLLEGGADVHFIPIQNDSSSIAATRSVIEDIAEVNDVELDMAVTFMPNGILVIGPKRRS